MDPTYLFTMNIIVFTGKAFCWDTVYLFIDLKKNWKKLNFFINFFIDFRLFWCGDVKNKFLKIKKNISKYFQAKYILKIIIITIPNKLFRNFFKA